MGSSKLGATLKTSSPVKLLFTVTGRSLVSRVRISLILGFLLMSLAKSSCERGQRKCIQVFSRWSMVNAAWNVKSSAYFWVHHIFTCLRLLWLFSPPDDGKLVPVNDESFTFPSRREWGAAGLMLNHFLRQGWCMYVCRCMNLLWRTMWVKKKKNTKEKKKKLRGWSVFCLFFCCKLVSVIDPVASCTHLAFGCPTCLGLCVLVQRVFFFFLSLFFNLWHL